MSTADRVRDPPPSRQRLSFAVTGIPSPAVILGLGMTGLAAASEPAAAEAAFEPIPMIRGEGIADQPTSVPGWRAAALLQAEVSSAEEPEADRGDIRDLAIGLEAQVVAVLIEAGGHFGIGEMIFSIPWNEAVFSSDLAYMIIDRERVHLAPYSPYGPVGTFDAAEIDPLVRFEGGEVQLGPGLHSASDLLDGRFTKGLGAVAGRIADLIIDPGGFVRAVVAVPPGVRIPPRGQALFFGLFGHRVE